MAVLVFVVPGVWLCAGKSWLLYVKWYESTQCDIHVYAR